MGRINSKTAVETVFFLTAAASVCPVFACLLLGRKTVSTLEKTKVPTEKTKVLTGFSKVLTVSGRSGRAVLYLPGR